MVVVFEATIESSQYIDDADIWIRKSVDVQSLSDIIPSSLAASGSAYSRVTSEIVGEQFLL